MTSQSLDDMLADFERGAKPPADALANTQGNMGSRMGASFRLVKAETKPLTRELAEKFRDLTPSPTEREKSDSRIKYLQQVAEADLLVSFGWAIAVGAKGGELEGKTFRMNGQHSSTMLCGLDGKFPTNAFVHLDTFEVDNKEALALLFRQFDSRKASRSPADVSGAYQGLYEDLREVPRDAAKLGIEGIIWHAHNIEGVPVPTGDDKYSRFGVATYHEFLRYFGLDLFSIKTPELKNPATVAAIWGTWQANKGEARRFWNDVARGGVEFEDQAPATVLDAWLKDAAGNRIKKKDLKPGHYYQACIYAWNAFRDDRTLLSVKFEISKGFHRISE